MFDDLDDILSDDSLFEGLELDSKLFDSKRYKRTVSVKTKSHQRKSMGNHLVIIKIFLWLLGLIWQMVVVKYVIFQMLKLVKRVRLNKEISILIMV